MMKNLYLFKAASQPKYSVGIELCSSGIAICMLSHGKNKVAIKHVSFQPFDYTDTTDNRSKKISRALSLLSEKYPLFKSKCDVILAPQNYQLLLVEAPNVPKAEMRNAVLWSVKDLVSLPQEFVHIDVFELPKIENKITKKMVYVVVIDKRELKNIIESFNSAAVDVNSINIQEMALRDLLIKAYEDEMREGSMAVVRITEGAGYIFIFNKQDLFLSRQFKVAYAGGLLEDLPGDVIQTEIQRSLDYYERQMSQSLPQKVLFFGENIVEDKLNNLMSEDFSIKIEVLNISFLDHVDDESEIIIRSGLGALGAGLRQKV